MTAIPVSRLKNYYKNPRRGNVTLISESLNELGQFRSIVVNEGTKTGRPWEVLVGNHTFKAAKKNGLAELECKVIDVDEQTAARIVLADNRTSDMGTYDDTMLLSLLEGLDDMNATGFTDADIDDLLIAVEPPVEFEDIPVEESRFEGTAMRAVYVTLTNDEFVTTQAKIEAMMKTYKVTSAAALVALLAKRAAREDAA